MLRSPPKKNVCAKPSSSQGAQARSGTIVTIESCVRRKNKNCQVYTSCLTRESRIRNSVFRILNLDFFFNVLCRRRRYRRAENIVVIQSNYSNRNTRKSQTPTDTLHTLAIYSSTLLPTPPPTHTPIVKKPAAFLR